MIFTPRVLMVMHRGARAGTEFHVFWLARSLMWRGWKVDLAVSQGGPLLDEFRDLGVGVHLVPRLGRIDPAYVVRLARLARRSGAHVLHAHSGRLPVLAGRLAKVPRTIETRHGLGWNEDELTARRLRAEARRCRAADRTITVSRVDRERLIAGGLAPQRVYYIPNGIPKPEEVSVRGPIDRIRVGFLGRLAAQKDPLFLAAIAQDLDRRCPGAWTMTIAGDGPLRGALEHALRSHPVRFLGETPGSSTLFREIDLLCVPSAWEGQPIGVLEAMAAGVPVLARNIPTLAELVGGDPPAGILLPPAPAAWAEAIVSLSGDAGRRKAVLEQARQRVQANHGLEGVAARVDALYRQAMAAASPV